MSAERTKILLFDVDGTLTAPLQEITKEMKDLLMELKKKYVMGVVGGSDLTKIQKQVGANVTKEFDYVFAENGLVAYKDGQVLEIQSFSKHLGEKNLQLLLNGILKELSEIWIPIKRGTFIEFRNGMLNVSPIGRNCSQQERIDFFEYDKIHQVRSKLVAKLQEQFKDFNLKFSIGGQISFDVFPIGWDKTYCLKFLRSQFKDNIYFFGDKTMEGGNDYEIYSSSETEGISVDSFQKTMEILSTKFL